MKKTTILLTLVLILSPVFAFVGTPDVNAPSTNTVFDSDYLVQEGTTLFYDIDQLSPPSDWDPTGFVMPDLAGNQLYIKIMYVEEGYDFGSGIIGTRLWYAMGLMFGEDETFTIGEGITATDITIPAGAATPSGVMKGVPHFNSTSYGPAMFTLNNNWTAHNTFLSAAGFTVTDGATEFEATIGTTGSEMQGTWRKSDGILTHLLIDDIVLFGDVNFTDVTMEFTFDRLELNPLPASVGDIIEFQIDIADLEVTGEGDLYDNINQTELTSVQDELQSYVGKKMIKLEVTEVKGVFYKCDSYSYNEVTDSLELTGEVAFNGFFLSIASSSPFSLVSYDGGLAPWITPDWTIYEGQMKLFDTLIGVYVSEILDLMSPPTSEVNIGAVDGEMDLVEKQGFYFMRAGMGINMEMNITSTYTDLALNAVFSESMALTIENQMYIGYTSDGIGAAIRAKMDVEVAITSTNTAYETGSVNIVLDFKLRNPLYDPPDVLRGGFIPGFTWAIAIPSFIGLAVIGLVIRKRK